MQSTEIAPSNTPVIGSAPSFTFGGANAEPEASGSNKKILIGAVAAVIIAAVAYVGWSRSQGHDAAPAPTPVAVAPAALTLPGQAFERATDNDSNNVGSDSCRSDCSAGERAFIKFVGR